MSRLLEKYHYQIVPALQKEWELKTPMAVPRLLKIVVNIGIKEGISDKEALKKASEELALITSQKPQIRRAKKSIASFKLVKGAPIGLKVTLRGKRMYDFLDKLCTIVLPRVRDFHGLSPKGFDGRGNYTLGLAEQIVFPEVDYEKVNKVRGLEITIITNAETDEKAKRLLDLLGMPFKKEK